mmetsp:Transcript_25779/g.66373  ORF Transcript_25779/g.66373 Transcript_25779/m.66373 type:complete len:86 (+) Transcript_25779:1372-1629(+)
MAPPRLLLIPLLVMSVPVTSQSVQLKHVARSLQVSQLTGPQQLLCGVGENNGHVHFMFVYKDPLGDEAFDDKLSLSYKLPVREDL